MVFVWFYLLAAFTASMTQSSTLQPMAFPTEIFSGIIKIAMLSHSGNSKCSIMLTNHLFLNIARPLFYYSTELPDAETASVFFTMLRQCEADDSDYGPHAKLIIHLQLAYEPGSHNQQHSKLITEMSQLQSITTDFRDDCQQYPIENFSLLLKNPPTSLQTIWFISINVDRTKVNLACPSLAVMLIPPIGRCLSHQVGNAIRSGTHRQALKPFNASPGCMS
jgi:hypothetical protein